MTTSMDGGLDADRGRDALRPSQMTWEDWKNIIWRVWAEFSADRVTLVAAGATFYLLLALFPALAAFVSVYGFVADPVTISDHIAFLGGVLPAGGIELIETQLESLVSQDGAALSFGFLLGFLIALWSANNGIKTLFEAMNIAFGETEKRSFVGLNLLSLLFTVGAIIIGMLFIVGVGVVPAVLAFVGLGSAAETLISLLRWPVMFAAAAAGISILYRYGPSRERAKWRWVNPGAVLATAVSLLASILFSWYLTNFADYNATYGSLGAAIGFMMWTWISVVILIAGAELNSELEHQTARDSTTGEEAPMGTRGATMADTLGRRRDAPDSRSGPSRSVEPGAAEQPSGLGTVLGFALPVIAVATRLALDEMDRRRAAARLAARPPTRTERAAQTARAATARLHPLWERGRSYLGHPSVRDLAARSGRKASERLSRLWSRRS